jgi:hypothetical protein
MNTQDIVGSWAPTVLCALNVGMAVYYFSVKGENLWYSAIIAIPLCFFFVSVALYQTRQQLSELRQEMAALRQTVNSPDTAA